jgi:hypothetical protein
MPEAHGNPALENRATGFSSADFLANTEPAGGRPIAVYCESFAHGGRGYREFPDTSVLMEDLQVLVIHRNDNMD